MRTEDFETNGIEYEGPRALGPGGNFHRNDYIEICIRHYLKSHGSICPSAVMG